MKVSLWKQMALGESDSQIEKWTDSQGNHLDRKTIGSVRQELVELPDSYIDKLPAVVQTYWQQMGQRTPTGDGDLSSKGVPSSPVQVVVTTPKLWEEHHEKMTRLVKRWSDELNPHLSVFRLRNLNDPRTLIDRGAGLHRRTLTILDSGSYRYLLLWQVNTGETVCLTHPLEVDPDRETRIVRGYLHQHLQSSSYRWLLEDTKKGLKRWKQIGGEELIARAQLLNRIDRAVEKLNQELDGKRNPLADSDRIKNAGLTRWFNESIWLMVLGDYYDSKEYNIELFEGRIFKVRYGAEYLGLAATREDGEAYIRRHKELISTFAKSGPVAAIKRLMKVRESLTSDMRDAFTKLVVDKVLPGKCDSPVCHGGGEWGNGNSNKKGNG